MKPTSASHPSDQMNPQDMDAANIPVDPGQHCTGSAATDDLRHQPNENDVRKETYSEKTEDQEKNLHKER